MADKLSRKSSMRTRNGSKDLPLATGAGEQEAPATTSKLAEEESTASNYHANKRLSKKRKSSSSLHKKDSSTSDLAKRSASTSKSTANNSSVSSTSSTDSISYKSESTKKHKKKQRLNQASADVSSADTATSTNRDSSRSAKSKAIVKLSNSTSNSKSLVVDFEEDNKNIAIAGSSSSGSKGSRRRQSNDSSSQSGRILRGHRNDSNISLEALSNTVEEITDVVEITDDGTTVDIDDDSNQEPEEEHRYQNRLRRPSSSSSKSTTRFSADNKDSSLPEVKPTKRQKLNKSNQPTTSRSSDTSDQKRKTGACISKSCDASHLTSSSRRNQQQSSLADRQPHQPESSSSPQVESQATATASIQEAAYESKTKMSGKNSKAAANKSTPAATTTSSTKSTDADNKNASTASAAAAKSTSVRMVESGESSDNDTSAEFNRLSDILQSRGLPSHIVNAFGSKVQQFLHRTMSSGISSRSQNLISTLQQPDDSLKLTALAEICQLLVMGNEDTLVGFPIKQAVPLLLQCMNSESENFDLMNHACRALTYMMESLPRSSGIIAEGIGIFLEKLQVIQCMDVAEQSLTALEILSRRHSKQILNATQSGSISACLTYIDFFSITAQRNALQITASCCQNMIKDEFVNIQSSLPILSQRLTHSDKKSVESVCTIFSRLVENFQKDSVILKEIASHNVLSNLQQLLVVQPSVVSPSMFVTILHTIYLMCANCNELATELLENNISNIFITLLVGNTAHHTDTSQKTDIEILSTRTTQELYEIVSIIGEIMPSLPKTGLFSIDETLRKTYVSNHSDNVSWQWKDEREVWRPYTPADSQIIESSYSHEENECILNTSARSYVLDFQSMMQINEETGTARPIARKVMADTKKESETTVTSVNNSEDEDESDNNKASKSEAEKCGALEDSRLVFLKKNPNVYAEFVSSLFAILYAVYSSSAGPAIKHRCLRSLLRMIYYLPHEAKSDKSLDKATKKAATADSKELNVLHDLLKNLPISSQIASMLASVDTKILVSALQMCEILMQKMPDIFSVYFHREGVIHQIDKLIEASAISLAAATTLTSVVLPEDDAAATSTKTTDSKKTTSEQNQTRKTRSSSSAAEPAGVVDSNPADPNTQASSTTTEESTTATSHSKRKARPSHASKYADSASHTNSKQFFKKAPEATTAKSSTESASTANQSLTSNTAKYFRSFMTKMQGNNNSSTGSPSTSSLAIKAPDQASAPSTTTTSTAAATSDSKQKSGEFMFSNDPLWAQFKSNADTSSNPFAAFQVDSHLTANQFILMKNAGFVGSSKNTKAGNSSSDEQSQQQKNSINYQQINVNKEKVRQWIYDQAKKFRQTYFPETSEQTKTADKGAQSTVATGLGVLNRLKNVVGSLDLSRLVQLDEVLSSANPLDKTQMLIKLDEINKSHLDSLSEISNIINETDISSFEMIHSGLIEKLASFLSSRDLQLPNLDKKLNQHSINYSSFSAIEHCNLSYVVDLNEVIKNEFKVLHCKQFFSIFSSLPFSFYCQDMLQPRAKSADTNLFSSLLSKLHNCVNQLEQFAVRVNDVPSSADGSGSKNAIKFFNTHQLKCLLRRHPACGSSSGQPSGTTVLVQWKGGPVKVDPLATVSTIEKYLVCRGIHRVVPSSMASSSSASNQTNIFANQKSLSSRFSKSAGKSKNQSAAGKSKLTSKSSSSRLFVLKAAAEMATDRFKFKKSRNSLKTHSKADANATAADKTSKVDSPKSETKKLAKANKKAKKSRANQKAVTTTSTTITTDKEATSSSNKKKSNKKSKLSKTSASCSKAGKSNNSFTGGKPMEVSLGEVVDEDEDDDFQDFENDDDEFEFGEDGGLHERIDEDLLEEDDEDEIDYEDEDDDEMDEDAFDNEELEDVEDYEDADAFDQEDIEDEIDETDDEDEDFNEDEEDDDEDDEDDIESAMSAILGTIRGTTTSASSMPKIELLINNQVLPSNMSVYQAIKTYSAELNKDADNELENSFMNNAIWSKLHMIHYRLVQTQQQEQTATPIKSSASEASSKEPESGQKRITRASHSSTSLSTATTPSKSNTKALSKSKTQDTAEIEHSLPNLSNTNMDITSTIFYSYLTNQWPADHKLSLNDQSLESISLLRILNSLNRNWYMMYSDVYGQEYFVANSLASQNSTHTPVFLVNPDQFVNAKLTAKANRQLQDPLVIMTGHLPKWLPELMKTCPFLFAFKTRLMHFYVRNLDRDRAMQKLIDLNANMATTSSESDRQNDRFVPKLDKKKRTIARHNDIIKQTDSILNEFCVNTSSSSTSTSSGASGSSSSYHSSKPPLLEIQYEGEVGTGLGPTLEFYALVSLEVQKCEFEMWRGDKIKLDSVIGQNQGQFFFFSPSGLFPAPLQVLGKQSSKQQAHIAKIKGKFKFLGKFVAKSVMDFRVIDIPLSYAFYKWLIAPNSLCENDINYIDATLFNSIESLRSYLRKRRQLLIKSYKLTERSNTTKATKTETSEALKETERELKELEETVEAIDLDFTLPGYGYELKKGGKDISVTLENLDEYLRLIVDYTLSTGVQQQLEAFREGYESIMSMSGLQKFYPEELERVFCGSGFHDWSIKALNECTRCDHGYTHDSKAVKNLFEVMCSFDEQEQRQFLQFITGSPRLPVGGLQSLVPPLTIVRKTTDSSDPNSSGSDNNDDRYLPSVMTCVNYLKLPDYSSAEVMKERLVKAMQMGQLSFHLS